jgi:hypothetical protein
MAIAKVTEHSAIRVLKAAGLSTDGCVSLSIDFDEHLVKIKPVYLLTKEGMDDLVEL